MQFKLQSNSMRKSKHIGYLQRLCNTARHISANVDGPVRRSHAKLLIMLYAKLDDEYDQLVCRQLTGLGHVYRRHRVLSTTD